jgi:uncharacterized GH25 family protein
MRRLLPLTLALVLLAPGLASAHKIWLLPSETVLTGPQPLVTVDAAISNDLFYFNHFPLPLDGLTITAPDGSHVSAENQAVLRYRSVFDVPLAQKGTYRITVPMNLLFASWEENGERKGWRGSAAEFATKVPADAKNLQVTEGCNRVETFVTNGNPTDPQPKPTGKGLELVPITHPNDLVAGETARFRLLVDGQPTAGIKIEIVRGGTRYRNAPQEILATTDANGEFSVEWPEPGMYWLEASISDKKVEFSKAQERGLRYCASLEVLPR